MLQNYFKEVTSISAKLVPQIPLSPPSIENLKYRIIYLTPIKNKIMEEMYNKNNYYEVQG